MPFQKGNKSWNKDLAKEMQPWYRKKRSKETKLKISQSLIGVNKGNKRPDLAEWNRTHGKSMIPWNKGKTKKTDNRIFEAAKAMSLTRRKYAGKDITEYKEQYNPNIDSIMAYFDTLTVKDNGMIYLREKDLKKLKRKIEFIIKDIKCPYCNISDTKLIEKHGLRKTGHRKNPRYFCNRCNKRFTLGGKYFRMRNEPQIIEASRKLYANKYPSRDVEEIIKLLYNVNISHGSIARWGKEKDMGTRKK